jgi:hypothetical protein
MIMRKSTLTIVLVLVAFGSHAQVSITPFAGASIKAMSQTSGLRNGGSAGLVGVEVEVGRNRLIKSNGITLLSGISYLDIDYNENYNLAVGDFFYFHRSTSLNTKYVQVPLMLKFNWQPSPLLEEWIISVGVGISNNFLLDAKLEEEATVVTYQTGFPQPPPTIEKYEDAQEVTDLAESFYVFRRIDIGMKLKRIQFAARFSKSLQDMYFKGLERQWAVPADESQYIKGKTENGKMSERYIEIVLGYTLWPGKKTKQQFR